MKRIPYLMIWISLLGISCTSDNLFTDEETRLKSNQLQLVARVAPFSEYDVASRAASDDEDIVYDFIIFGSDNTCVYYNHSEDDIINIDRASDFQGVNQNVLASCDMYVLANYPSIYNKILADAADAGATDVVAYIKENIIGQEGLDYFNNIPTEVKPVVNMSENSLPRIGRYVEKIDLRTDADIPSGTIYPVDLMALYAKMVFDIEVDPTEIDTEIFNANTFQFSGYTVTNLAKEVDLWSGTEGETHDDVEVYSQVIEGSLDDDLKRPATSLSFTCYLPERFFKPESDASTFVYPFGQGDDIRPEDRERCQRYKPLMAKGYAGYNSEYDADKDKKATFVTLSGVFTNHQGHTFDVSYDIYVGNDNSSNFDIVRNRQYNNTITIKGIQNTSDQSANEGSVSIDHRVNVKRTLPAIITLRREMLLDAHYEVRPMRIRRNASHNGTETHVKVEVIYDNGVTYPGGRGNWIGLERSFGNGVPVASSEIYCVGNGSSAGKRKYFTYDLVDADLSKNNRDTDDARPLHTSTSVVVPIPGSGSETECVWIYVDECTEASSAKDAKRSATIRVTCGTADADGQNFTPVGEPVDYVINQHLLFEVSWKGRKYWIEHEEEYLHNFDSEDTYQDNTTEFEGIEWGLYNAQLSFDDQALFFNKEYSEDDWFGQFVKGLQTGVLEEYPIYYDFYVRKHDPENVSEKAPFHNFEGYDFFYDIVEDINTKTDPTRDTGYSGTVGYITMEDMPANAIEYAYNRNKRDRYGQIPDDYRKWYLPAIDEMEDIMVGGRSYFEEFIDKHYWSCQPSYVPNYAYYNAWINSNDNTGTYYVDDTGIYYNDNGNKETRNVGYARATKAIYLGGEEYDYAPSGASGYEDFFYIYTTIKDWQITGDYEFRRSGSYNNVSFNTFVRQEDEVEEGNHLRSTKHRVRCVYMHEENYRNNKNITDY